MGRRPIWIMLGCFALVLVASVLVLSAAWRPTSAPDRVRPWANGAYQELLRGPAQARPLLSTTPAPRRAANITSNRAEIEVEREWLDWRTEDALVRVPAGPSLSVKLPGSDVELSLVAWSSPRDGAEGWRHPETGEPLDEERAESLRERTRRQTKPDSLSFLVEARGGPVRFLGPQLRDRRTRASLHSGSGWQTLDTLCWIQFDERVLHRTPLLLAVSVTYGDPEVATLSVSEGPVELGDLARVELLHVGRGMVRSEGTAGASGPRLGKRYLEWDPAMGPKSNLAVMSCWPPSASSYLQTRPNAEQPWSNVSGSGGLVHDTSFRAPMDRVEVRCFPEGAVVLFELPPLAVLPEVDNLFDVPLGPIEASGEWQLLNLLTRAVQAQGGGLGFIDLPPEAFPFEREEMTAGELLDEVQALTGSTIGFDPVESRFIASRPGILQRAWQTLRGQ